MSLGAVDLFQQLAQNDFGFFQKLRSVSLLMTPEVQTLTLDDSYQEAQALFHRGSFRHAPVVEDGEIVGIVSDRDLLRHRPPLLGTAGEGDGDHRALRTPVSQIMTRHPLSVPTDATLDAALSVMLDSHVDACLVRDAKQRLAGILTPADVMKTVLLFHRVCGTTDLVRFRLVDLDMSRGLPLDLVFTRGARSVRDVMTKNVKQVEKSTPLSEAMELMQANAFRHLPVTNDRGRVIGILSDRDILRHLPLPVPRPRLRGGEKRFREHLFDTHNGRAPGDKVSLAMTKAPITIRPEALLVEAITMMLEEGISALPVVDPSTDELCGILTTTDVLRVFRVVMQIGSLVEQAEESAQP